MIKDNEFRELIKKYKLNVKFLPPKVIDAIMFLYENGREEEAKELVKFIANMVSALIKLRKLLETCEGELREFREYEDWELAFMPFHVMDTMPIIG